MQRAVSQPREVAERGVRGGGGGRRVRGGGGGRREDRGGERGRVRNSHSINQPHSVWGLIQTKMDVRHLHLLASSTSHSISK